MSWENWNKIIFFSKSFKFTFSTFLLSNFHRYRIVSKLKSQISRCDDSVIFDVRNFFVRILNIFEAKYSHSHNCDGSGKRPEKNYVRRRRQHVVGNVECCSIDDCVALISFLVALLTFFLSWHTTLISTGGSKHFQIPNLLFSPEHSKPRAFEISSIRRHWMFLTEHAYVSLFRVSQARAVFDRIWDYLKKS